MSVKTIFKVIMCTILTIVIGSLVLEYFNIQTSGLQINSITKISARQACVFFGQETYKREDADVINMNDLKASDGATYINGKFYDDSTPTADTSSLKEMNSDLPDDAINIYTNLYGPGSDFMKNVGPDIWQDGKWESLGLLLGKTEDTWGIGEFYRDSMMTPLNMGIPYLEGETLTKIFRWNLASILNNGQMDGNNMLNVKQDEAGKYYVLYKGFRVYASEAQITNLEYKVLDLTTSEGKEDFKKYTNINPEHITNSTSGNSDERNKVCLVGVNYTVPVQYEGITPIKNVISYVWDLQVAGTDGETEDIVGFDWNSTAQSEIKQGGFDGYAEEGVLPVPGELVYYIVR